jgi:tetratricopeptide (TPR) repeat protein
MIRSDRRATELPVMSDKTTDRGTGKVAGLLQEAFACLREARISEGEHACRAALKVDPRSVKAWVLLGEFLSETSSRLQEAERALRKAISIDGECAPAWVGLGELLHEKLSRFDEAEQAYRKAVEISPSFDLAWAQLGELLHQDLSRFDEAEQAYRNAIEINPQHAWAWVQLGQLLHEKLSRFDEAEQAYRKAIEIDPQAAWPSMVMLRFLLSRPGRRDEAVRFAEAIIAQSPNDYHLLQQCACKLYEVRERPLMERALAWARQAVATAPNNSSFHHTVASIQCALGNLQDALKSAEKYVADAETVGRALEDATTLFTELAARGEAPEALQILLDSPSREQLEPLVAGIRIFLGQDVNVATEIKEIGSDVARRIEERRNVFERLTAVAMKDE